MIRVRAPRRLMAEINVVPYIDVMLVLLVVFMITAPMLTQGVLVELPQVDNSPIDLRHQEPVIISVSKDGNYYINVGDDQKISSSLESIQGQVLRIQKHAPDTRFLVEGDRDVAYGKVIILMAMLQRAGLDNLGLVTEPPEAR